MHDSARGSPDPIDGFHQLVDKINDVLGPCNGIDSAGIDVEELKRLMAEYSSNEADWERYAFADYTRGYTRNLVDNCNGKSNLVSISSVSKFGLKSYQDSPFHSLNIC
jgi:cysteine dioxygenase